MPSRRKSFWLYTRKSQDRGVDGGIVAGRSRLRILAILLASISGLILSFWLGSSLSTSPNTDLPLVPNPSTLKILDSAQLPKADLAELATRLGGRGPITTAFPALTDATFDLGKHQSFWVSDMHGNRFQIGTTLRLATAHSRLWVQDDLDMDYEHLRRLRNSFEEGIFSKVVSLLGDEALLQNTSVDFIFTDRLGPRLAGYFSPRDLILTEISETSNGRKMILLNTELAQDQGQLARLVGHELQHLLHWELDSNESAWMQEGYSELAERLVGEGSESHASAYLSRPDLQLNTWPLDGDFAGHYGASSLFVHYLHDRFGPEFISALAHHSDNGFEALDALLLEWNLWDPSRSKVLAAEDVVLDWGLANFLQLESESYAYVDGMDSSHLATLEVDGRCRQDAAEYSVSQYGFDFIRIKCDEAVILDFAGGQSTRLLPANAHSGQSFFWSNRGDLVNTRLTRQFDFSETPAPITLQFWTWYELEKDSDFVYLVASEDGQQWDFLETTSGNPAGDTVGLQFGFGFSGINKRHEWSRQTVDLSQFSGKRVTLRFEYVTDTSRTGEGFLIDDLSIVETDYRADFEDGPGGWDGDGFIRVTNAIPQQFRVSLIREGEPVAVEHLTLDASNRASVRLDKGEEVMLVIMGATRHTRQPALYTLSFTE